MSDEAAGFFEALFILALLFLMGGLVLKASLFLLGVVIAYWTAVAVFFVNLFFWFIISMAIRGMTS